MECRAEESSPVEGVSKDSTCHSFFYISPSSSNIFIILLFRHFSSWRNYSKRFYIKSGILWKSSNRLGWGLGKVLYKSETWSMFLWKCNCQLSFYRKMTSCTLRQFWCYQNAPNKREHAKRIYLLFNMQLRHHIMLKSRSEEEKLFLFETQKFSYSQDICNFNG